MQTLGVKACNIYFAAHAEIVHVDTPTGVIYAQKRTEVAPPGIDSTQLPMPPAGSGPNSPLSRQGDMTILPTPNGPQP